MSQEPGPRSAVAAGERPNILLIMSDQHHKRALGCASGGFVETPRLDALAARGVRFENAYCNFPLCGPSRMSFMTSRHPYEIGCFTNFSQLSSDVPTLAHGFLAAGYETVLSGRMHFVGLDQRHGFERRLIGDVSPTAHIQGGWRLEEVLGPLCHTAHGVASLYQSGPGRSGYQAYDEAVCRKTVEWLQQRARAAPAGPGVRPFFLTVGFALPHCPFVALPEDFYRYYERLREEEDLPDAGGTLLHPVHREYLRRCGVNKPPEPEVVRRVRAAYFGMVSQQDRQVGRLLDCLEASGFARNTLVVYTSDHGEQLGEHALWWKQTFYESSAGVPLIIAPPGGCAGRVVRENVGLMDLGPTLLDHIQAAPLPGASGRSFNHLLAGTAGTWSDEVFAEMVDGGVCPQRMLRHGPWKYNYFHGADAQLFNLDDDPRELVNRAADPACRARIERMRGRVLEGWDPEEIVRRNAEQFAAEKIIGQWVRQVRPPEPDPVWFEEMPVNEIDEIRV